MTCVNVDHTALRTTYTFIYKCSEPCLPKQQSFSWYSLLFSLRIAKAELALVAD